MAQTRIPTTAIFRKTFILSQHTTPTYLYGCTLSSGSGITGVLSGDAKVPANFIKRSVYSRVAYLDKRNSIF
jgi:hypothetical protein